MLTILGLLLSLAVPTLGTLVSISCHRHKRCQKALLSGNDIVLHCSSLGARWSYFPLELAGQPATLSEANNTHTLPDGSLLIRDPRPWQTGFYSCQDRNGTQVVTYEIDFQDVTTLYVSHKDLGQEPLHNETLSPQDGMVIFTRWEPWQDCNSCDKPGERRRLGYCHLKEPLVEPVPCQLFRDDLRPPASRMRPELQIEACSQQCKPSKSFRWDRVTFDSFNFSEESGSAWLTCPTGSIYRPILWEVESTPLTWQDQLSGHAFSAVMDTSNGGRQLQIFQPAIYSCFVQQELVARFNPAAEPEVLQAEQSEEAGLRQEAGKANSVLQGLKLTLLVATVLVLVGALGKFLCPSEGKRRHQMLLVK